MALLDEIVKAAPSLVDTDLIRWGQVISTGPLKIRFAGDTADTDVALQADGFSLSSGDKVTCLKIGAQWVVVAKLVDPANASGGASLWGFGLGQWPPYESGKFYPGINHYSTKTPTTIVHDYLTLCPIVISRPVTITSLVGSNNSTTITYKWGLYSSDSAGFPVDLLDSGTKTTSAVTEAVSLTTDLTLSAGIYWMAVNPSASTGWYYMQNYNTAYYFDNYTYQDTGQTTAALSVTASGWTSPGGFRVAHTYEDDLPDPMSGVVSSSTQPFVCGFEVA